MSLLNPLCNILLFCVFIVVVVNFVHLYLLFCNIILYVAWFCYVFMCHVLLQLDVNGVGVLCHLQHGIDYGPSLMQGCLPSTWLALIVPC